MRLAVILFVTLLCTSFGIAQHRSADAGWTERISGDATSGVLSVAAWHDIPVGLLFLAHRYYKADNPSTKLVSLPPFEFERSLASDVRLEGEAFGSLDSWILPAVVFNGHLLYAIAGNVTSDADMRGAYARTWGFAKVMMYNLIAAELIKNTVRRARPDASDTKSFFSSHTSTAFAVNSFLYREIDDAIDGWDAVRSSPTLSTGLKIGAFSLLYGWAVYVGYSRMVDSKHYISDVLVGAASGTLIANLVYDGYFGETDEDFRPVVGLVMIDKTPAVAVAVRF
ncbi:MAG: phosphatase PAP2 family protein [Bacteroidetes bacterium]|nr:phosphatase PAP2 family protein [Bacteroidota bacterium]